MELFQIKINGPMEGTSELYVRVLKGNIDRNTGAMHSGTVISLDTYFNMFSCGKYLKWTNVTSATAEIKAVGRFKYQLLSRCKGEADRLLWETENEGSTYIPLNFENEKNDCSYYIKLCALEDSCVFLGGRYTTDFKPAYMKTATIICTYKREEYLLKNISALRAALLDNPDSPVKDALEIFVVDNGQSLSGLLEEHPSVKLFPNKNCGGSGGFTRGLIEALKRKDEFTHVLLMDDDIIIDPNVIEKTIQFQSVVKAEFSDLHIAGGMLYLDNPLVQHEATARWNGNIHPNNTGLNLACSTDLIENEIEKKADYGAWWYLCFPLSIVNENNLPLPLFIKGDDIEYGLRNMKHVLIMNGIGVWHEGFIGKERPYLDYYIIRNYMIIGSIHKKKSKTVVLLLVLFRRMMRAVIFDAPEIAEFVTKGVKDYLDGPDFIIKTDSEKLNTELRSKSNKVLGYTEISKKRKMLLLIKKVPTYIFWRTVIRFIKVSVHYLSKNKAKNKDYKILKDYKRNQIGNGE